ncbi:MAG: OmpA family protein [Polyangiaceae bacterium]|nr:OmpA family protein [Polyangiaceae bacterium]
MAYVDHRRERPNATEPSASSSGAHEPARTRATKRRGLLALASTAIAAALFVAPNVAKAQTTTMYLDRLFIGGAPEDAVGLWRPYWNPKTRFFGQLGMGFALNPFRVENHREDDQLAGILNRDSGPPVRAQLISYLGVGTEILDRVSIQVNFPIILAQGGNKTSLPGAPGDSVAIETVAPMDMRLDARVKVFQSSSRNFALGLQGGIWLPTGNELSFGGDPNRGTSSGVAGILGVAAEYRLKTLFFVFNTGFQFRPPGGINDFKSDDEWRWGFGAFMPLRGGALRLGAQIFGSTGITDETFFNANNTPLEWMAEGRFAIDRKQRAWVGAGAGTRLTPGYAPDMRVVATVGYAFSISDVNPPSPTKRFKFKYANEGADTDKDGLPDDIDLCPTVPEDKKPPNTDDGCPAAPDRDGDGIPDANDKCPDEPEDFDKVDDKDGCPEDDPDKDGIADAQDACPKEPGDRNADAAKNGCPNFIRRISGSNEIQILKKVEFATGKSTILQQSYPILDEVVKLLKVNPEIKLLAIEGHTDNRGSDALNEKLSADRAKAVLDYLVNKGGIDASRLTSQGFGPQRPIADNNTNDGRQRNRRVEFIIKERSTSSN